MFIKNQKYLSILSNPFSEIIKLDIKFKKIRIGLNLLKAGESHGWPGCLEHWQRGFFHLEAACEASHIWRGYGEVSSAHFPFPAIF